VIAYNKVNQWHNYVIFTTAACTITRMGPEEVGVESVVGLYQPAISRT